jgi:hypothetical protein
MRHSPDNCERIREVPPVWRCLTCGRKIVAARPADECPGADGSQVETVATLADIPCHRRGDVRQVAVSACGTCERTVDVCACLEFGGEATLAGIKIDGRATWCCLRCDVRLSQADA